MEFIKYGLVLKKENENWFYKYTHPWQILHFIDHEYYKYLNYENEQT